MSEKLIFNCTYGKEEPERATLPFVAANIAATAGQDAVVLLTIEAVWLGTDGGTDGIAQPGLPVLDDLYQEFIDNGGSGLGLWSLREAPRHRRRAAPRRGRSSSARPRSSRRSSPAPRPSRSPEARPNQPAVFAKGVVATPRGGVLRAHARWSPARGTIGRRMG